MARLLQATRPMERVCISTVAVMLVSAVHDPAEMSTVIRKTTPCVSALTTEQSQDLNPSLQARIVQRGAVPPLIMMLGQTDVQLKEMGAFALGRLAQNADNQAGIVQVRTPEPPPSAVQLACCLAPVAMTCMISSSPAVSFPNYLLLPLVCHVMTSCTSRVLHER